MVKGRHVLLTGRPGGPLRPLLPFLPGLPFKQNKFILLAIGGINVEFLKYVSTQY